MGKYDVTVGQYCQFLNAVAATDTYGLYNSFMGTAYSTVGITQTGSPGSYTYSVSYTANAWNPYVAYNSSLYPSALAAANDAPVFDATWGDCRRFAEVSRVAGGIVRSSAWDADAERGERLRQ
jgi:formylglycine-generating enzyme required for sulfatase activity